MIVLGLTGSIGMGKSTVAAMFRSHGIPVFDADAAVRALQGPGGRALEVIERLFPGTTGPDGLDRQKLGNAVFGNAVALARLEALMHPLVGSEQVHFLKRHIRHRIVVLDIPLLFEKGSWKRCDATVVVSAPARIQRQRVMARPGMTVAKFDAILRQQMPDAEKRRRADFIIPTGRGKRATRLAVKRLVACIETHGVRYCESCVRLSSIRKRRALIRTRGTRSLKLAVSN